MSGDVFFENFQKVYPGKGEKLYAFKTAYGLLMLGEAVSEAERRVIGMGISPNTIIGIRLCDEDIFYLREMDSEIMYECPREELSKYRENNWAQEIFCLLGRLTKSINVNGAQILFHRDCESREFANYPAATALGFSSIFAGTLSAAQLLNLVLPDSMNFAENARELISLCSAENKSIFVENHVPVYFPTPLEGYKIIIALTGEKPFKTPDFKSVLESMKKSGRGDFLGFSQLSRDEIELYRDMNEYYLAIFARDEAERVTAGAAALKRGDIISFGKIVKQSSEEYLSAVGKNDSNVSLLFRLAVGFSAVCGIYKNKGIFAAVPDRDVDRFVDAVGSAYEKKAGVKPEFYICASSAAQELEQTPSK